MLLDGLLTAVKHLSSNKRSSGAQRQPSPARHLDSRTCEARFPVAAGSHFIGAPEERLSLMAAGDEPHWGRILRFVSK